MKKIKRGNGMTFTLIEMALQKRAEIFISQVAVPIKHLPAVIPKCGI
jgi:hypothetical protein